MAPTIDIVFSKGGKARLETSGFSGSSCVDAVKFLESALGHTLSEEKTAAFYEEPPEHVHEIQ